MVIQVEINGEKRYYLLPEHAEEQLIIRNISENRIRAALLQTEEGILNPRGRQEFMTKDLKVVVEDDDYGQYDGIIATVHEIN